MKRMVSARRWGKGRAGREGHTTHTHTHTHTRTHARAQRVGRAIQSWTTVQGGIFNIQMRHGARDAGTIQAGGMGKSR